MPVTTNTLNGIVINELGLSHNHAGAIDVNNDGIVNNQDSYIELYNTSGSAVDVSGWEVWAALNNGGSIIGKIGTIDPATSMAAGGRLTLTEPLPATGDFSNIAGPAQELDESLHFNNQSTYALYDPTSDKYLLLAAELASASTSRLIAEITDDHAGATQEGGIEVYPALAPTHAATARVTDGDTTWQFKEMTPGAANCFADGTMIATDGDEVAVEALQIGQTLRNADGQDVAVAWVGRQTIIKRFAGEQAQLVKIAAGALGHGMPHTDLHVTADHGIRMDGLMINASVLVNGSSIDWIPLAETEDSFVLYHVETASHDVILANGVASETYLDTPGRRSFDNFKEYQALYGAEKTLPEIDMPRISSQRLLPAAIKARLGITDMMDHMRALVG